MPRRSAFRLLAPALAGLLGAAELAAAQEAEPVTAQQAVPAVEAPVLGAPEGAVATTRIDRPFDRYALPVAAFGTAAEPLREVEGRVIWAAYRLEDPDASTVAAVASYRERLSALGFTPILDCANAACGGFDFRFGVQLLPAPLMLIDTADFAQLSARRAEPGGGETLASVLVSRVLGAIQIQTVLVQPAKPGLRLTETSPPAPTAGQSLVAPQDEASLLARLTGQGHVVIDGLEFKPGGAELSPGSAAVLETTARQLKEYPELQILIVGHSDNMGGLEANMALSQRRAEAVRDALIERGVKAERMEAHGVGFLSPITSNASPEGMATNRRVELVLR